MALLTREQIFKIDPRTFKTVKCPELGGAVRLQSLLGTEFEAWTESNRDPVKKDKNGQPLLTSQGSIARLLVRCVVDKAGQRLFSDDDAPEVAKLNAATLNRLGKAALEMNGVGENEIEDLVKNSGSGREDDAPSS